ncbi:L-threonylcarbamoyladenylate synthase [Amphibiibacter pelophylacis]|uniref:L-threonylcarbamoyladenylate synthase n=1 Tax=Amphibiibacter pelophylacis TaxID=1799477 RepID=A0ACC6P403_9BURK
MSDASDAPDAPAWWPSATVAALRAAQPHLRVHDAADTGSLPALAQALARGELVAFPTETVYGLGARADDDAAVARIYAAKGRPPGHPLIVHVASPDGARAFIGDIPTATQARMQVLMQTFWPGPLTLVLPRRSGIAAAAAGGHDTIALRCPAHPLALALLQAAHACGVAGVAAPSANRFGHVSPTHAGHVADEFGPIWTDSPPLHLLAGVGCDCAIGIESTIVDLSRDQPVLLRPGGVTRSALEHALGQRVAQRDAAAPRVSGDLASHYAPQAPLQILPKRELLARLGTPSPQAEPESLALGTSDFAIYAQADVLQRLSQQGIGPALMLVQPEDAPALAHELFAALRHLDAALAESGGGCILVQELPPGDDWDGVRDRLQRAAAPRNPGH